jgi:CRP-like cAMP-binding protein
MRVAAERREVAAAQEVDRILIILDGEVSAHVLSSDSCGQVDFTLGPGECIGGSELASTSTFTATTIAASPQVSTPPIRSER